jgi:D-beta-D-heptose 7-phosphate kinase / D-beta-D-heptose 1-phosphate adenosyltransferase
MNAGTDKRVDDRTSLRELMLNYRRQGRTIVFTNGCFDIIHAGHVSYLHQAKGRGDVLVVGLNSDGSIRRLKGPERPINRLRDRVQVLSALSCVDHVVPFEEDTAEALIELIRPDVFVKGGDYRPEKIVEAPLVSKLGGRVEVLPLVANRSTTNIIRRIRQTAAQQTAGT